MTKSKKILAFIVAIGVLLAGSSIFLWQRQVSFDENLSLGLEMIRADDLEMAEAFLVEAAKIQAESEALKAASARLEDLSDSKRSYINGLSLLESGQYWEAIQDFELVLQEDSFRFADAQKATIRAVDLGLKEVHELIRAGSLKDLRNAIDALSDLEDTVGRSETLQEESIRVTKLITAKQNRAAEAKKREVQRAIDALRKETDTFEGITWYHDRATYSSYAGNKFLLYMGQRESGAPWLRLRFMMYDEWWHFFESIVVDVDGSKYYFTPGYSDVKRNNGGGDIWEWWDKSPTTYDIQMLNKIVDSKSTRIRYINGDNFYEERTVSSSQKKALRNVLTAFDALGGTL